MYEEKLPKLYYEPGTDTCSPQCYSGTACSETEVCPFKANKL